MLIQYQSEHKALTPVIVSALVHKFDFNVIIMNCISLLDVTYLWTAKTLILSRFESISSIIINGVWPYECIAKSKDNAQIVFYSPLKCSIPTYVFPGGMTSYFKPYKYGSLLFS